MRFWVGGYTADGEGSAATAAIALGVVALVVAVAGGGWWARRRRPRVPEGSAS